MRWYASLNFRFSGRVHYLYHITIGCRPDALERLCFAIHSVPFNKHATNKRRSLAGDDGEYAYLEQTCLQLLCRTYTTSNVQVFATAIQ